LFNQKFCSDTNKKCPAPLSGTNSKNMESIMREMRELTVEELSLVSGGTIVCCYDCGGGGGKKEKGNNGYGNGGKDGVPGNSDKQDYTR
jgi:hypothetical protein